MSTINKGEVAVILDGTERTLKPSLQAYNALGSRFESQGELLGKIAAGNLPAIIIVIRFGLGMSDAEAKKLPELVMKTGLYSLREPVSEFVFKLFNGGKSAEEVISELNAESGTEDENPLVA